MNVLIADVGGDNATYVARALTEYAAAKQLDCKINKLRIGGDGGSVITHLRFGDKVYSPTVPYGSADAIISFDILEAARVKSFLSPKGILLVNDCEVQSEFLRGATYPRGLKTSMLEEINGAYFVDAASLARGLGVWAVMLGAFNRLLGLDPAVMRGVVGDSAAAFDRGMGFLK